MNLVPLKSLQTTFAAPLRPRLMSDAQYPASYSRIVSTPIIMGENDIHGDCVCVAAFNAVATAKARDGDFTRFDDVESFDLYEALGGMPADVGLNPGVLFTYWQSNPIGGYRLKSIESIALDDVAGIEQAIIDNGFVYFAAMLDDAQMTQSDWVPVPSPVDGGHATLLTWWEAGWFYDATWASERRVSPDFIAKQGINLWRLELAKS
ncbi:MAG: hypothetical protein P4L10_11185 [Acidobacteriaceae bacterium]|nr:hypothetical protein [Acidobacteriaceae bacterium]